MPRDGGGTYTLPAGNPVIPGTIIETTWANPTMDDIAAALTDSLSRTGSGGMIVPFLNADGTVALPGISWANQQNMGFWRPGLDEMRVSVAGVDKSRWTSSAADPFEMFISSMWVPVMHEAGDYSPTGNWDFSGAASFIYSNPIILSGADVSISLRETGGTANEGVWNARANADQFVLASATDGAPLVDVENAIVITRSGTTIGPWTLKGGQWDFNAGSFNLEVLVNGSGAKLTSALGGLDLDAVSGSVALYGDGTLRLVASSIAGQVDVFADGNGATEQHLIQLKDSSGNVKGDWGWTAAEAIMHLSNRINGQAIELRADDFGGTPRVPFSADPDTTTVVRAATDVILEANNGEVAFYGTANGKSAMYHNNNERARTLTAANGGLEVDNQDTGVGFERVLTTSDLGGGGGGIRGALAYRTTTQSIPNAVFTSLLFTQEAYDTDNIHNNVTNPNRLTVPAGVTQVRFHAGIQFVANFTGTRLIRMRKNGLLISVDDDRSAYQPWVTFSPHIQNIHDHGTVLLTGLCLVAAGDWFELQCWQSSGGNLNTIGSRPFLEMEIIA